MSQGISKMSSYALNSPEKWRPREGLTAMWLKEGREGGKKVHVGTDLCSITEPSGNNSFTRLATVGGGWQAATETH